jgi:hypothetical protein
MKPYTEEKNDNIIRRTFSNDVPINELTWHRDHEDRIVKVISETDWMIQFDNELPKKLNINETVIIPKNTFHRVIKGSGDLVVEITETDFSINEKKGPCWKGYEMVGMKEKDGKEVPNCIPIKEKVQLDKKDSIFAENIKDMILYKLHEMDTSSFDTPVKEPIVKPETPVKTPSPRRQRIWEVKPAVAPKPKM